MFSDQNSAVRAFETPWTTWPAHDRKILPTDVGRKIMEKRSVVVDTEKDKVRNTFLLYAFLSKTPYLQEST